MSGKKVVLFVVMPVVLIIAIVVGVWAVRYYTAETRGKITATEEIQSAEFRIYSYDHFFDICGAIRTNEANLDLQTDILDGFVSAGFGPGDDKYDKQMQNVAAQSRFLRRLKEDYNQDADKEGTRGQFKAECLPPEVSTDYEYGKETPCECDD